MIKALLAFVILFAILYFGIEGFRSMTNKEKWVTTKTTVYAASLSLLTFVILTVIVVLF
jgi:hypothetical protein